MKVTIETNRQESDDKMKKITEYIKSMIKSTITSMMDHINISKSSLDQKYPPNSQYPTTMILANRRDPTL